MSSVIVKLGRILLQLIILNKGTDMQIGEWNTFCENRHIKPFKALTDFNLEKNEITQVLKDTLFPLKILPLFGKFQQFIYLTA